MKKIIFLLFLFLFSSSASAAIVGVINSTNKYAKIYAGPHAGTQINFRPNDTVAVQAIEVYSDRIRGYAWGEATGWIVFSCEDTASGCSSTNGNFKVLNDGAGHLSGHAWGEATGWISFSCSNTTSNCSTGAGSWGVSINSGDFSGYAWSQNFGYIQFNCSVNGACLSTDWAPSNPIDGVIPPFFLKIVNDTLKREDNKIIKENTPPTKTPPSFYPIGSPIYNDETNSFSGYKSSIPEVSISKLNNKPSVKNNIVKKPASNYIYKKIMNPLCKPLINLPTDQVMSSMLNINSTKNILPERFINVDCETKYKYETNLNKEKIKTEKSFSKWFKNFVIKVKNTSFKK